MIIKNCLAFFIFFFFAFNLKAQKEILSKVDTLQLFSLYRNLHQHPELSGKEVETAQLLKGELKQLGFTIIDSLGFNSFAGILKNGNGPTVLYRTDMDGLPIKETTGAFYASTQTTMTEGWAIPVMHACGHDFHMSSWVGVARILSFSKKKWKGTVIFLAQSSEETGQGAKGVIHSNYFSTLPKPTYQLAIHDTPDLTSGTFGFCNKYSMAAVDMMNITIYGKGGHGAEPFKAIDPILLSANFITEIQSITSRNLAFNTPAVITVGAINGGTVGNIIPDKVELKLTIRTFSPESRLYVLKRIEEIGNYLALAAGLTENEFPTYNLLDMSIPAVYNAPKLGEDLKNSIQKSNSGYQIADVLPKMIGEDFGIYSNSTEIPSYLIWVGVSSTNEAKQQQSTSLHTSTFLPDYQTALPITVDAISNCIIDLLNKH